MPITGDFFDIIQDKEAFLSLVREDYFARSQELEVTPIWNEGRALDAFFQWKQDLERVQLVEDRVKKADHLKCAAHLIYWLRRSSPVDEFSFVDDISYDGIGSAPSVEFMLRYGREYLAFDLGYRAAQLYECNIHGRALPETSFSLQSNLAGVKENDFIETVGHVLKLKNVSPHAIFLVLKAVFLRQ